MQASLTAEEQQLMDRLREKYRRPDTDPIEGQDALCIQGEGTEETGRGTAGTVSKIRGTSNVDATVCQECQGTGTRVEIYNHRRLEQYCQACEGRGVHVFKDGVEVKEGHHARPSASTTRTEDTSGGGQARPLTSATVPGAAGVVALQQRAAAAGAPGGAGSHDAARLEAELRRIDEKLAAYAKERQHTQALLQQQQQQSAPGSGPEPGPQPGGMAAAASDLLAQLDAQVARLGALRGRRQAALDRLGGAAGGAASGRGVGPAGGLGIRDIIASEGAGA